MHASAPTRPQNTLVLSADNIRPDRFAIIDTLRQAGPALGLGPQIIATLDALLSCLPVKRSHNRVFASNATIMLRRNGISDRTLRRHFAQLVEAGFLIRFDSPNGKRYSRHDPEMGTVLRFGLDLSPLFAAYGRLRELAEDAAKAAARNKYLRCQLRAALSELTNDPRGAQLHRMLRRKLTNDELEHCLQQLGTEAGTHAEAPSETHEMSGNNGQNVRHQQSSKKELNDKGTKANAPEREIALSDLAEICPQASSFLQEDIRSPTDVVSHARQLAPMIGIEATCYEAAERKLGMLATALTIWGLLEKQDTILRIGAYFRAITIGPRSEGFCPWQLLDSLKRRNVTRQVVRGQFDRSRPAGVEP